MYYGNENAYSITKNFILHWGEKGTKKATILTGRPGIGKTFLTSTLSKELNIPIITINASAARLKKDVSSVISSTHLGDKTIIVLDECEGMKSADLTTIIKGTCNPVILCCNFLDKIDYSVRKLCNVVKLQKPPWFTFRDYIADHYCELWGGEGLAEVMPTIEHISKKVQSFRHANNIIEDTGILSLDELLEDVGTPDMITEIDEVEMSLRGNPPQRFSMPPDTLIHWINDNADDPDTISKVDICNERAYLSSYKFWKYSYALLGSIRSDRQVKFPRTFGMMSHAKKQNKDMMEEQKKEPVKIDNTKVIMTSNEELEKLLKEIEEEDAC